MYLKRLYIQYQTSLCLGFGSGAHFLCHCPLFLLEGGKNKWWLKALKYLCGTESSQEDHNDLSTKPRRYQDGLFVRQAPLTWSAVIGGGIEVTSVLPLLWQDLLVSSSGAHSVAWETETRQKKKKVKGCQRGQKRQSDEFFRCYTTVTQWPGVYSHKTMQEKKQERKPDPNLRTVCLLCKHGNVFVGPELLLRVRYQTRHLKDAISILIAFTPNSSNLRPFFFLLLLANNCGWLCLGLNYRCRQLQRQWCVCIQAAW